MFGINEIFRPAPDIETFFEGWIRLVAIIPSLGAYFIRLDEKAAKSPFPLDIDLLISEINNKNILKNQIFDFNIPYTKESLSSQSIKKLEARLIIMSPLLHDTKLIYDSQYRAQTFKNRAEECHVTSRTIHRLYLEYLRKGQTELSLAPLYFNSGGPGVQQFQGTKKVGPKCKTDAKNDVALPEIREKLIKGANRFFLLGKMSLPAAYTLTKKYYFNRGVAVKDMKSLKLVEIELPEEELPTKRQFRYICDLLENQNKRKKLPGHIRARKEVAVLKKSSRAGVPGPGFRFEIDATKLQVKIVSRFNRSKILGTPTLYIIIDVWSGAITGYAFSTENPSWALAATALYNCFTSKEKTFDRLGLDYKQNDWPCNHLPTNLAADRGEFISNNAQSVPEVGITLEIMPAMRPDRKGKVEATFNDIKHGERYDIPGSYPKNPGRRESNGDLFAALTPEELERIIVDIILDINCDPVSPKNIPIEMLEENYIDVTHIGVYKWGLDNRFGFTRTMDKRDVYTNFLNRAEAKVTATGIRYNTFYYMCETLIENGYLINAKNHSYSIEIRFHPHMSYFIWFFDTDSNEWCLAEITDPEIKRMKLSFLELNEINQKSKKLAKNAFEENTHKKDEKNKLIKETTSNAVKEAKKANFGKTKTEKRENIRNNKTIENEINRMTNEHEVISAIKEMKNYENKNKVNNHDDSELTIDVENRIIELWDEE